MCSASRYTSKPATLAFSAAGPQDADEHFHSCGLARSAWHRENEDLAGMHFKADVIYRSEGAELAGEVANGDNWFHIL